MKTSCVSHPSNEPLILIHKWQVALCEGSTTAAALLSFLEYWHNIKLSMRVKAGIANDVAETHGDKRTQDESLLQFHTENELVNGILGLAGKDSIRKALKWLERKGLISICRNPNPRYAFDKTRYFLFHPEAVNAWLSKTCQSPSPNPNSSSPKNRLRSSANPLRSSKNQAAITEITPEITPETSLSPLTPQGEPEEEKGKFGFQLPEEDPTPHQSLRSHPNKTTRVKAITLSKGPKSPRKFFKTSTHAALVYAAEDTPWLEEPTRRELRLGQPKWNREFLEWGGKRFARKFEKSDLYEAIGDFRVCLEQAPEKILTRWEEYEAQMRQGFENAIARAQAGVTLDEKDRQTFEKHHRALAGQRFEIKPVVRQISNIAENAHEHRVESVDWEAIAQESDAAIDREQGWSLTGNPGSSSTPIHPLAEESDPWKIGIVGNAKGIQEEALVNQTVARSPSPVQYPVGTATLKGLGSVEEGLEAHRDSKNTSDSLIMGNTPFQEKEAPETSKIPSQEQEAPETSKIPSQEKEAPESPETPSESFSTPREFRTRMAALLKGKSLPQAANSPAPTNDLVSVAVATQDPLLLNDPSILSQLKRQVELGLIELVWEGFRVVSVSELF